MTAEPTPEALAWMKREADAEAQGILTGTREICPDCLRPVAAAWGADNVQGHVPRCSCGTKPTPGALYLRHGLDGVPNDYQRATITYG